ncbi:MAG: 30S ribosomal protein S16 [Pseudomonadota bacterium]
MVIIRLAQGGRKKHPFYHIVVTNSRQPRDGRYIERLGYYNPNPAGNDVPLEIADERVNYWLSQGVKLSKQVKSLLKKAKKAAQPTKSGVQDEVIA